MRPDRASPIIGLPPYTSLKRRKTTVTSYDEKCSRNYVINTQHPRLRPLVKGNPALDPSAYTRKPRPRRSRRFINYIQTRAISIRQSFSDIHDVNDIDRWSRLCFPILFILFNASYWAYYLVLPQTFEKVQIK